MSTRILITIVTLTAFNSLTAFAMQSDLNRISATHQTVTAEAPQNSNFLIKGELRCASSLANLGAACALSIVDTDTGKSYALLEAASAMRLYMDGHRTVRIVGQLQANSTIKVTQTEAL